MDESSAATGAERLPDESFTLLMKWVLFGVLVVGPIVFGLLLMYRVF